MPLAAGTVLVECLARRGPSVANKSQRSEITPKPFSFTLGR